MAFLTPSSFLPSAPTLTNLYVSLHIGIFLLTSIISSPLGAEAVFAAAFKDFQNSLVEDNIVLESCQNAQELVVGVQRQIKNETSRNQRRLLAACKKIDAFGQTLQSFFEVVDIFISSHPEFGAIAWGSLRLIFKVASDRTLRAL